MKLLVVLAVILGVAFGSPVRQDKRLFGPIRSRIIGGDVAEPHQFPYLVSLQLFGSSHSCGGSIIGPNHVLTAAHCLAGIFPSSLSVAAGVVNVYNNTEANQQRFFSSAFFLHPTWDDVLIDGDVGVIEIAGEFEFNDYVKQIPIANQDHDPAAGTVATNMGWGYTYNGAILPPQHVHYTSLDVLDRQVCIDTYAVINPITQGMMCANKEGVNAGSCSGDSGSPLMCKNPSDGSEYCCGTVSWGIQGECGNPIYPTVFGNVGHYSDWIKNTAQIKH